MVIGLVLVGMDMLLQMMHLYYLNSTLGKEKSLTVFGGTSLWFILSVQPPGNFHLLYIINIFKVEYVIKYRAGFCGNFVIMMLLISLLEYCLFTFFKKE